MYICKCNVGKCWHMLANVGKCWQMVANGGKWWQMVANGRRQKVALSARAGTTEVSTSTLGNWPQKCCRGPVATSSVAHVSTVISCVRLSWSSPHTDFPGISAEHSWTKCSKTCARRSNNYALHSSSRSVPFSRSLPLQVTVAGSVAPVRICAPKRIAPGQRPCSNRQEVWVKSASYTHGTHAVDRAGRSPPPWAVAWLIHELMKFHTVLP